MMAYFSMQSFSVLMSLYCKEQPSYLDECFGSLACQSIKADEIVLVLDGPIGTELYSLVESWLPRLPIKLVALERNVGLGRALAEGLKYCSHDLVARMDTDDICFSDRFQLQLEYMHANPSVTICGSWVEEVDPDTLGFISNRCVPEDSQSINAAVVGRNPFNHMTVMYRRSAVMAVGGYEHLDFMEDYGLWCRLLAGGNTAYNFQKCLVRARTGLPMLKRRSGWRYIVSEYKLFLLKLKLRLHGPLIGFGIFMFRAMVRAMPSVVVGAVYRFLRRRC